MAAVLSAGPSAVLSHRSAASLWGILPSMSILPEVTKATRCHPRSGLRAHCAKLRRDEITRHNGIPVTSPPRTMVDIAALATTTQLETAFNELEVRGITDALSIPDLLDRYPRRRGSSKLKALLADEGVVRGITRKELEARFAALVATTDLPRPQRNVNLAVGERFVEVDCLWRAQRLIVELDGGFVHGTWRTSERDREKDRLLMVEGWRVVRVTWRHLRDDAPAVIADLRGLLRQ
jgi:hypothetical protein